MNKKHYLYIILIKRRKKKKKSMTIILSLTLLILNLSAAMFCPDTGETIPGFANSHYFEQSTQKIVKHPQRMSIPGVEQDPGEEIFVISPLILLIPIVFLQLVAQV